MPAKFSTVEKRQVLRRAYSEGLTFTNAKRALRRCLRRTRMGNVSADKLDAVLAYAMTRSIVLGEILNVLDTAAGRDL